MGHGRGEQLALILSRCDHLAVLHKHSTHGNIVVRFGDEAMTKPELKSPAELEKVGPAAKEFVKEFAYMPVTGQTVALESDSRGEVIIKSTTEVFSGAIAALAIDTSAKEG